VVRPPRRSAWPAQHHLLIGEGELIRRVQIPRRAKLESMWDADLIRDRIRWLAREDPGLKRFGAKRHRYHLGLALTEDIIRGYEERHDFRFPAAYRDFLLTVGDGGAGPCYGLFHYDGSEANWAPRRIAAEIEPGSLAKPFPHTGSFQLPESVSPCPIHPCAHDDEDDPCWWNGSIMISEIGCGAFYRLVVSGPASGQVWIEDFGCDDILSPGPDFYNWYMNWLDKPGVVRN
jgi:hypothetical protein